MASANKAADWENGGQGQNRTADTRIFSPLLYRLSYLAISCAVRTTGVAKPSIRTVCPIEVNLEGREIFRMARCLTENNFSNSQLQEPQMLTRIFTVMAAVHCCLPPVHRAGRPGSRLRRPYIRHAGPELNRVRYSGFIQGWQPVGDDSVLMSFSRNEYYLFELSPPCNLELRQATHIALKTSMRQSIRPV